MLAGTSVVAQRPFGLEYSHKPACSTDAELLATRFRSRKQMSIRFGSALRPSSSLHMLARRLSLWACVLNCLICCAAATVVKVSTAEEFLDALASVSDSNTIEFQAGRYTAVCGIPIRKTITIVGSGRVELDCAGQDSQFQIIGSETTVALSNLEFVNGFAQENGGCLSVASGANAEITSCTFTSCAATHRGGALFIDDSATARISESSISLSHAALGGAVDVRASALTISSCKILNNSAVEGGGIFLESSSLDLRDDTLLLGNVAEQGGGVAAKLMENRTDPSIVTATSGVVFQENLAVPLGRIAQGGAIYLLGGSSLTSSGAVSFVGNEAHSDETSTLDTNGGAIYISGPGTLHLSGKAYIAHNYAHAGGGLWIGNGAFVDVRDGPVFAHNTAQFYGGGLYAQISVVHLEDNVLFEFNSAMSGGAILLAQVATLRLFHGIDFVNNHANNAAAMFFFHMNKVETRGRVSIHDNVGAGNSGAVYLHSLNVVNLTQGTTLRRNTCRAVGAGISVFSSTLFADNVEFTDNVAGIGVPQSGNQGGGLRCQDCTAHLSNCYFARNRAHTGGGIFWAGQGTARDCRFEENLASVGGGVAHLSTTPVTLDNSVWVNNTATADGGCLYSAESSVLFLRHSTFNACSAAGNGAALMLKDDGEVHVSGSVVIQSGTAGGSGGAIHHQGRQLVIEQDATMTLRSNSARGGGGVSSTSRLLIQGHLNVVDNAAREVDGGGIQAFGALAVITVAEQGWLSVDDNEAVAANGGGVALLDNARLVFDLLSPCPSSCQGLGDGDCDPSCMMHQCRWDAGDCNERIFDAGDHAAISCSRIPDHPERCPFWSLADDSGSCFGGCLSARCDWGFGSAPCSPAADAIGQCPFVNALIYRSIVGNQDVRYIKEGGTVNGYGRCESDTCSPADPSIGRDEPYCVSINDDGRLHELECADCVATIDVGEAWGPCSEPEKPRLPFVGFDYDPSDLLAVLDMDIPDVFRQHKGCGYQPIAIRRNRAAQAGGGVYKDRCDAFLESVDRCFVGELNNQRLPSVSIDLADNHAGGPGGGVFVECGVMSACLRALAAHPGLPANANATARMLHFGEQSSAEAYGSLAAALPVELELTTMPGNATPGQTLLDLRYRLLDTQGLVVHGSSAWPNPHMVEVVVCRVGDACTAATALQTPFLLRSHPTDGETTTLRGEETLSVCPVGEDRVEAHIQVAGEDSPGLHKSVVIGCEPCGPGQEMILQGEGAAQVWSCRSCQPTDYVVSAEGGCQPCPLEGAMCDGLALTPTVDGAQWEADGAVMRVEACPAGYVLVRDPARPVLDACVQCPPGTFSVRPARYPGLMAVVRASDAPLLCSECVRGADCLGGDDIIAQSGFWQDVAARSNRRAAQIDDVTFYQCAPGACEGNNTCSDGHHGPVCGLCDEEWGRRGIDCVYCGTDTVFGKLSYLPSFIVTVVCFAVILYCLTWRPLLLESELALRAKLCCARNGGSEGDDTEQHVVLRYLSNIHWTSPAMIGAFKVAVSFYQVASTFHITFRIDWPDSFGLINSLGRLTGLDLSLLLPSVSCVSRELDYVKSLAVFTTAFPIGMTVVLCFPYILTRLLGKLYHGGSKAHPTHDDMQRYCLRAVLLWFFLIYPTVSEHTLATFLCQDLGSGGHVLVMDTSVACPWGGSSPSGGFYFALFLVFLYPIGIPAFFYYVVWSFFVPAMAEAKYARALVSELIKLYRTETTTPVSIRLAQHVGSAPGSACHSGGRTPGSQSPGTRKLSRAGTRLNSEASESLVPLNSFKRRVSQLFTKTFVQREMSGVIPESSVHDKLQHVLDQFGCTEEEVARLMSVLQRLSINAAQGDGLDAFEQLALKIAHNHFLFSGHESLNDLSLEQLQALFLFDWEGLNRKRSDSEIRKRKVRRQRTMQSMDVEALRLWVHAKAREMEKAARISVPALNWNGETPEEERALGFVGFLFDDFRVQTWWFFLLGEFCKLIMTSVLVFIPGRSWQQLAWGLFCQVVVTALYDAYQPMAAPWLNRFQVYALGLQCAILFFGLLLSVSDMQDTGQQQTFQDWATLIVTLKWTLIAFPMTVALISKSTRAIQLVLWRLAQGGGEGPDSGERDPTCLERWMFPTAVNTRQLRRASTQSEIPIQVVRSGSNVSGLDCDFSGRSDACTTPTVPPRLRGGSTVDATLVSSDMQDNTAIACPVRSDGPPPSPPSESPPLPQDNASSIVDVAPQLEIVSETLPVARMPRPVPAPDQSTLDAPYQSTLELSVTPTPRQ